MTLNKATPKMFIAIREVATKPDSSGEFRVRFIACAVHITMKEAEHMAKVAYLPAKAFRVNYHQHQEIISGLWKGYVKESGNVDLVPDMVRDWQGI